MFGLSASIAFAAPPEEKPVSFVRDVRPILARNCFACHGPDEKHREAGLRLDVEADAKAERDGRRAIVAGDLKQSELWQRITSTDPDVRMPPQDSGKSLTAEQIELIQKWIAQGAAWQIHWAFEKPVRPTPPSVKHADWPRSDLDRFVQARLEQEGLAPSPEADPYTLARRVALDLTGLPPDPALVERFVADPSDKAYERLVDELLQSPAYGERWARMWLDLARFADTKGYEKDLARTMWRYRDWVIDAFNADLPYDQFTREQLAGDLLPDATLEQQIATAFHRNTMVNDEGGTDNEEFRVAAVKDRVDTTLQVWMGLTMGCAKCHSHKYDPITNREYYQFYAFFNQTEDADDFDERPKLELWTPADTVRRKALQAELDALGRDRGDAVSAWRAVETSRLRRALADIQPLTTVPVLRELPVEKRRVNRMHVRGNFLDLGEEVEPAIPVSFHPLPESAPKNRLGVAEWLMHLDNPLTARVAVNRAWGQFFGRGLVETQEDFGSQGQPPSHPEVLDWLAVEFREQGWSWKRLCKTIVMSATYRQSSKVSRSQVSRSLPSDRDTVFDRDNRLLARGPRFRLEAEMIRDSSLAVSGLLSRKLGGPSVMPPQPEGVWRSTYNTTKWQTSAGEDRYRRGLYTFVKRTSPYPAMTTFDAPSRELCTVRRINTNTPLQALVTLNDTAFLEMAQALARRMVREAGSTVDERLAHGIKLVLGRPANPAEISTLRTLYESRLTHYRRDKQAATEFATQPLGPLPDGWPVEELAALTAVSNVLLNLDEFLTRG
jgi:hypothetical protein